MLPILLMQFQNCGNVNFNAANRAVDAEFSSVSSAPSRPAAFAPPSESVNELRAVFVVDMSASMATTNCAGELDEDSAYDRDCTLGNNGSDPKLARLKVIEAWLTEINNYLVKQKIDPSKFKAALIPFSAPADNEMQVLSRYQYPRRTEQTFTPSVQQLNFVSMDKIRETAQTLMAIQLARTEVKNDIALATDFSLPTWLESSKTSEEKRKTGQVFANMFMQTSYPAPKMSQAFRAIENELKKLRGLGTSASARFEIVYLSDGFQKPTRIHMEKIAEKIWEIRAIYRNLDLLTQTTTCTSGYLCYVPVPFAAIDYSATGLNCAVTAKAALVEFLRTRTIPVTATGNIKICLQALLDVTSTPDGQETEYTYYPKSPAPESIFFFTDRSWGDYKQNTSEWISYKVSQIENLFNSYPEVAHRSTFVRVENTKTGAKPRTSDLIAEKNWLVKVKTDFPNQRHATLTDGEKSPFSLFPGTSGGESYQLGFLYALNLSARVNDAGMVEPDSDGDGLFDSQEVALDSKPLVRRSDGKCLDSIVYSFGVCPIKNCEILIDEDGDGLNQCEELKLGTSDRDFDFDNDGIPDGVEVVYGYNPTVNDRAEDSDGNQMKNIVSFQSGLSPYLDPNTTASSLKNDISVFKSGTITQISEISGAILTLPTYVITLHNLVRAPTQGSEKSINLYRDRNKTIESTVPFFLKAIPANTNQILLIGRMDNVRNVGDGYWIYFEKEIPYSTSTIKIDLQADQFKQGAFLDPQGGGN